ncbi:MAG: hypothetical protein ACQEQ4_02375 [Fibrobacterota bacterium]
MYKKAAVMVKTVLFLVWSVHTGFAVSQDVFHTPNDAVMDSVEANLEGLEENVASTTEDGGSWPVEFRGQFQLITNLYRYAEMAENSYLMYDKQNLEIGAGSDILNLEMTVNPGRNVDFWATMGVKASFLGHNFYDTRPEYYPGHHYEGEGVAVDERLAAGIAIRTKLASFMLEGGAINWIDASPLSIWKGQPRVFAWERMPYEIEQPISQFYEYNIAYGFREGRAAWNKKAFQGLHLESENLPGDFNVHLFYGAGNPTDKGRRAHLPTSGDVEYQADYDEIAGTGYGDAYTKHLFYRINKHLTYGPGYDQLRLGFNNGYTLISDDVTNVEMFTDLHGTKRFEMNRLYQFGYLNSQWADGDDTVTFREVGEVNSDLISLEALNYGYGQWVEPRFFTFDAGGTRGDRFRWEIDLGISYMDTTRVYVDPREDWGAADWVDRKKVERHAMTFHGEKNLRSDPAAALFTKFEYGDDATPWNLTLQSIYAGEDYNAPFSFVAAHDYFYPLGSNLIGPQTFVDGTQASPYSQNSAGGHLTVEPELPDWYGHLRFKYGFVRQLSEMRDILFFPYRLNGVELNESLLSSYARYGTGEMTAAIGGDAQEYQARLGDESYRSADEDNPQSPASGGLRGDYKSTYEGFVPYGDPAQAILNLMSASSDLREYRNIESLWAPFESSTSLISPLEDGHTISFNGNDYSVSGDGFFSVVDGADTSWLSLRPSETADGMVDVEVRDAPDEDAVPIESYALEGQSNTGFVPASQKNSFNFAADWGKDLSGYVGYKNDLFMSLYYEINGVTKNGFSPFAVDPSDDDMLLMSHYLRSEPAIGFMDNTFYLVGLFGFERWISQKGWIISADDDENLVIERSNIEKTDLAYGLGFDWDVMRRVIFSGRYKRYSHEDANISFNDYTGNHFKFEIKAFF